VCGSGPNDRIPPVIPTSHLRVYRPIETFGSVIPHRAGLPVRRLGTYGIVAESLTDDALVAEWNGRRFACPRLPRLRMLEGIVAMHNAYRHPAGGSLVPEAVAGRASTELEQLRRRRPTDRSHILTSAWHVPLRWFVPFSSEERHLSGTSFPEVRYRTGLETALERLRRAIRILSEVELVEVAEGEVGDVLGWLAAFPPGSMVELDFGSAGRMLGPEELVLENSVGEVWEALEALEEGDWMRAGEAYTTVVERWSHAMSVAYSN